MLTMPPHLAAAGLDDRPLDFAPVTNAIVERESEKLDERVTSLQPRAGLMLAAGIGEWIYWRLCGHSSYDAPRAALEAAYAVMVDARYFVGALSDGKQWMPHLVERPMWTAEFHLYLTMKEFCRHLIGGQPKVGQDAVCLSFLARHVLPDKKPFTRWLRVTLARLEKHHLGPRIGNPGTLVPREALDPDFDYRGDPEQNKALCRAFLEGLDHESNPWLRSPEELKQDGLAGEPYTL